MGSVSDLSQAHGEKDLVASCMLDSGGGQLELGATVSGTDNERAQLTGIAIDNDLLDAAERSITGLGPRATLDAKRLQTSLVRAATIVERHLETSSSLIADPANRPQEVYQVGRAAPARRAVS